jgi:hypothetical protein
MCFTGCRSALATTYSILCSFHANRIATAEQARTPTHRNYSKNEECGKGREASGLARLFIILKSPSPPPKKQVRVTGNNRTKGALVGLTGVVKKAVGLGGWHWLVSERAQSTQGEDVSFFVTWGIKIKNKSNGLSPNVMFLRQIL